MAQKPFRDITDRDFFASLVMAGFAASSDRKDFMAAIHIHTSRAVEAADHLIASLKVPVGGKPKMP
jgi:hypothetical protein